ncbi:hypothetical protein QFC22_006493 [Naganishia vaughanmartiniae]|uniref:Uncharacterized protein n=1 Tax=Naganishia vaughanmartiniae TaxID=1424756 RepID=A0ACC2WJV3_9TREE|nr:hypothetical protein QFC22_006493 [Naganishia vaughanmartiniae]
MVGRFKIRHPDVYSVADVGYMIGGRVGREFIAIAYWLYMTCVVGSGLLSSIALNAISTHGTCTAVFVAVSAVAVFLLASIQTLEKLSFVGWVGSVLIVTIAVTITERPAAAPQSGPYDIDILIFGKPSFASAMGAVGQLLFAWAGTPAMFGLIAEMRRPQDFTKALLACQTVMVSLYLAVAIVVYYYCGQYVASPALGSAGPMIKKIAYGM